MSESFSFVVVPEAVHSRLPRKVHDWWHIIKFKVFHPDYNEHREVVMKTVKDGRAAITIGWPRVMRALRMEEGTIWAFRFTFSSNQNVCRLSLYSL